MVREIRRDWPTGEIAGLECSRYPIPKAIFFPRVPGLSYALFYLFPWLAGRSGVPAIQHCR